MENEENPEVGLAEPAGIGSLERGLVTARAAVRTAIERAVDSEALDSPVAAQLAGDIEGLADVFALHEWAGDVPALRVQLCRFPGCFNPPRPASGPGKPPVYCEVVRDERGEPAHTAVRSMRARNRLRAGGPRTVAASAAGDQANERPVSWARTSVPDLVARVEKLVTDQQAATNRALADLRSTVALLGDDEARAAELESVQHDTATSIEQATGQRLAAEQGAREARAAAERARTGEAEAIRAAEEALERTERAETEAAARIDAAEQRARQQADADAERVRLAEDAADQARQAQANAERAAQEANDAAETARREASEQVTAAREEALEHQRRTIAERDRVLAERQAALDAQLAQIRTDAEGKVREAERATARAEQAAEDARTDRDRLAEQLARLQAELVAARTRTEATEQRHRGERVELETQLRTATEQATTARVELATITAQLAGERAGRESDRQAAQDRLTEAREQAHANADQRVAELRATYEERLAEARDRIERADQAVQAAPAEDTPADERGRRRPGPKQR